MDTGTSTFAIWKKTGLYSGLSVISSMVIATITYWLILGIDDVFPVALGMSAGIPLVISVPLCRHLLLQHDRQMQLLEKLRCARQDLREANRALRHQTTVDGMTGLPNREAFFTRMNEAAARSTDNVVMIIDADRFKSINDHFGHHAGDEALMHIVAVLKRVRRPQDAIGRIGGEEFGILLPGTSIAEARVIADMIRHEVENIDFRPLATMRHSLTVSIGIAMLGGTLDRAIAMRHADIALFQAKRGGRNRTELFTPEMDKAARLALEANDTAPAVPISAALLSGHDILPIDHMRHRAVG